MNIFILSVRNDSRFLVSIMIYRFEEVSPTASACQRKEGAICIGGLPRVFTAAKQLLKERPNAILLNAGDHYQGTLWYNLHRWNATVTFFNMVPWDVLVNISKFFH